MRVKPISRASNAAAGIAFPSPPIAFCMARGRGIADKPPVDSNLCSILAWCEGGVRGVDIFLGCKLPTCQVQWEVKLKVWDEPQTWLKMFFFAVKSWGGWVNSHPAVGFHIPRDVFVWSQESEGSRSDETTTDMAQACTTNKVFSYPAVEFPHARWIMFLQMSSLYKFKQVLQLLLWFIGLAFHPDVSRSCWDRFTPVVHWFCV